MYQSLCLVSCVKMSTTNAFDSITPYIYVCPRIKPGLFGDFMPGDKPKVSAVRKSTSVHCAPLPLFECTVLSIDPMTGKAYCGQRKKGKWLVRGSRDVVARDQRQRRSKCSRARAPVGRSFAAKKGCQVGKYFLFERKNLQKRIKGEMETEITVS